MNTITDEYEYKYLGDQNIIDINTLLTSQFHFAAIMNEIQKIVCPEVEMKIKIRSFREGTFNVNHLFEFIAVGGLIFSSNIEYIKTIFSIFGDFIKVREFLGGKKADSTKKIDDKIEININSGGAPIIISEHAFNIYKNNLTIDKAFRENIKALENDPEIEGVEIKKLNDDKSCIILPKENYEKLKMPNPYFDKNKKEEMKKEQVFIKKPDYVPKNTTKWTFIFKGRNIEATINDTKFIQKINDGERFGQGDSLIVDLISYFEYDEKYDTFLETGKFEISNIHEIKRRGQQSNLFKPN